MIMKKINVIFTLAVVLFSLVASYRVNAAQVADSVCVVTVSKDGNKVLFSAGNGFVDHAPKHPESYLFTNSKYVKFVKGENMKDTDKIAYESTNTKNIQYYHDNFQPWKINEHLSFINKFYISPIGDEGSCRVDGTKLFIRKSAVLDSLKVTLSYYYGKGDSKKDSVINMTLPVDSKKDIQIYNTASSVRLTVERPVLGKISEVLVDEVKYDVADNYFRGKSFNGEIKSDINKIQITTFTIDDNYNEVENKLSLNVVRVNQPKDKKAGGFICLIMVVLSLVALGIVGVKYGTKYRKANTKKERKTQPVNTLNMTVGEKLYLHEKPEMLTWAVLLLANENEGENLHLTPNELYNTPVNCNSSKYSHIIVYDASQYTAKKVYEDFKKGKYANVQHYKVSEYPQIVVREQNGALGLYSINKTNSQETKLETPAVTYLSKDSNVVRVIVDNEIKADAEGKTYVYTKSNNEYGWHINVTSAEMKPKEVPESKPEELNPQTQSNVQQEIRPEDQPEIKQELLSDADRKLFESFQRFVECVMQAMAIDAKKVFEAEGDAFDRELKNVVSKISRNREMFKIIDEHFASEFDQNKAVTKVEAYKKEIDALIHDSSALKEINKYLKIGEESEAIGTIKKEHTLINDVCATVKVDDRSNLQNKLNALMSADANYCALKTKIADRLKFDGVNEPEAVIEKAAEHIAAFNLLAEENKGLKTRVQKLEEYETKYNRAADVHESNRDFYLSKLNTILKQLDVSLQRISSNVLSSSQAADMLRNIYTSSGGFKAFYDYVCGEDWSKYDKIVDIKDAMSERLDASIGYDRSWVNGIARFYAYLRVPQLEVYLASLGISKMDFEAAFNAVTDLYTIFCDYTEIIVPALFVEVYNPDIHGYNEQAFGNVISAVCSEYDSFRDNSSALLDLSKLGYRKSDGTYVKPEVIF